MRRGYGTSGWQTRLSRQRPLPLHRYEAAARKSAEDLRVAIDFGSKLPQVDPTRALAVASQPVAWLPLPSPPTAPKNLIAAINFAGGRGSTADHDVCNAPSLVAAYRNFGKHSRTPMLWITPTTDKYFWPELAQQFDDAFRSAGGRDQFITPRPFGEDGHTLFNRGIPVWGPMGRRLPQNTRSRAAPAYPSPRSLHPTSHLPGVYSVRGQQAFRSYLTLGPQKGLRHVAHHFAFSTAQMTPDSARKNALENCNRLAAPDKETCSIVFEENSPTK